ncbi:MAG: hypothetical protein HN407_00265 [Chloroflexi bacterium]|jgi:hypothetical protein|nr:hypothetical protein [Chloroflexota bacterium]
MLSEEIYLAILDTINHPLAFVDNDHVIRLLNQPAMKFYYDKRGYSDLIGKSILDCHIEKSNKHIIDDYKRLLAGENEIARVVSKKNTIITLVAVRAKDGSLLGYYQRFEKIGGTNEETHSWK